MAEFQVASEHVAISRRGKAIGDNGMPWVLELQVDFNHHRSDQQHLTLE